MGSATSRLGSRVGPNGTQFIGDIRGQARYGLPLESHPVQLGCLSFNSRYQNLLILRSTQRFYFFFMEYDPDLS